MTYEEAKSAIQEVLKQMGAVDITFLSTQQDSLIIAVFNCKEVTSFVANIPGWRYSGIQLDDSRVHQYKIDFVKTS